MREPSSQPVVSSAINVYKPGPLPPICSVEKGDGVGIEGPKQGTSHVPRRFSRIHSSIRAFPTLNRRSSHSTYQRGRDSTRPRRNPQIVLKIERNICHQPLPIRTQPDALPLFNTALQSESTYPSPSCCLVGRNTVQTEN